MPQIEVIRSARRKKSVQARLVDGRVIIRIPASLSEAEEQRAVEDIMNKLNRRMSSGVRGDEDLENRARHLSRAFLEGRASFTSIRWVSNQKSRWGSCSIHSGEIRISDRLKDVPAYVLDAVLVHELTHTFIPDHSAEFWEWANRAPSHDRARGYLEAFQRWRS